MSTDSQDTPEKKIGYTKPMIEWRRNKVLNMLCKGFSQAEIAKDLQLNPSTISLDVQFLKEKAKEELQTHITERIPFEYNRAVTGINNVLRKSSEILDSAEDTKTKMECLKLQMELYRSVMSLATDGGIIEQAFKKVEQLEGETKLQNLNAQSVENPRIENIEDSLDKQPLANQFASTQDEEPEEDIEEE